MNIFTGGDWPVFFIQTIRELPWWPQIWSSYNGNGFGQNVAFVLGYKTFFALLVKFFTESLHLPWSIVEFIIFFIPFWILAFLSSYVLSKHFIKQKVFNLLSSVIFATNTYALMLVGGGQMGVALAYAFSPFVFLAYLSLLESPKIRRAVIAGLLTGLLICIDPRIGGIILFTSFIFSLFFFSRKKMGMYCLSVLIALLLNSFWIIPFLFSGTGGLTEAYTGTDMLYFLSFAKLENTIGLLHPNWPENFFGKVGFMRPEFLLLPLIAFSSFLFKTDKKIKVLGLVALMGIFLSKGVNDPLGVVYYFLSDHIPAFTMFRDATKWYLMIILAYSILIPLALYKLIEVLYTTKQYAAFKFKVSNKLKKSEFIKPIIVVVFMLFWSITIRQLYLGQLTGTFQRKQVPDEYVRLEKLIAKQNTFFRVLWVPQQSRFGYYSNTNPGVATYDLITSHDLSPTFKYLSSKTTERFLQESAVRYVIVPYDPLGEIYLTDRKYDNRVYKAFMSKMSRVSWLTQDKSFKHIGVFKVQNFLSHAYVLGGNSKASLHSVSLTNYAGDVRSASQSQQLVFSEQFDPHWVLKAEDVTIFAQPYKKRFNLFTIPKNTKTFTIEYTTQRWVDMGVFISATILIGSGLYLTRNKS